MSLYKYTKKKLLKLMDERTLPNLEGPLCATICSSSIEMENKQVRPIVQGESTTGHKRGFYKVYTASEKANVAKCAAEFGVTNTIWFFASEFASRPLIRGPFVYGYRIFCC